MGACPGLIKVICGAQEDLRKNLLAKGAASFMSKPCPGGQQDWSGVWRGQMGTLVGCEIREVREGSNVGVTQGTLVCV